MLDRRAQLLGALAGGRPSPTSGSKPDELLAADAADHVVAAHLVPGELGHAP
jgi:hypothetical protein